MDHWQMNQRHGLPLEVKIRMSKLRIRQFYEHYAGRVWVSFSGGRDSTVLLYLVRSEYPDVPAVYFNTGIEFPEIDQFIKTVDNVEWVRPKKTFRQVLDQFGYPVISKDVAQMVGEVQNGRGTDKLRAKRLGPPGRLGVIPLKHRYLLDAPFKISAYCCTVLKKAPAHSYSLRTESYPYVGTLARESQLRTQQYLKHGCNRFDMKNPSSHPISFWTPRNIREYLQLNDIPYSPIYDMGYDSTGCVYCLFGILKDKVPNRFQILKQTHPRLYKYCRDQLHIDEVCKYIGVEF